MTHQTMSIGELAASGALVVSDGYRTRRSELGSDGFRILRAADVLNGSIRFSSPDFVRKEHASAVGLKVAQSGDVILTTKGTVGRVAVVPELTDQAVYSPQLCFFRVRNPHVIDPRFLRYWFDSAEFWTQACHRMNNSDMAPYINLADVRSLRLSLPSIRSQRAIAEVLGALDDKIAANRRTIQLAADLASVRFAGVPADRRRPQTLGSILSLEYGRSLPATRRVPGPVHVFGSGGLTGDHNETWLEPNGVVVGRKGTVGAVYWAPGSYYPIDTTFYVVPKPGIPLIYCYHALRSIDLASSNSDSAVPGLNRSKAYAFIVRVPDGDIMKRVSEEAELLFSMNFVLESENRQLGEMRGALLPHLMSGRLRVRDAEKQVEDVV